MSEPVELEQLSEATAGGEPSGTPDLRRLSDVPIDLSVEIGRARMTVGETLELRPGAIVTLNRMAGEPVDLLVNGTPIARGEVVVIDEQFGVRVTEVVGSVEEPGAAGATAGGTASEPAPAAAAEAAPAPPAEPASGDSAEG